MIASTRPKPVDLTQGSDDWHNWRKGGIGASESAIIVGLNPYESLLQLWRVKVGLDEPNFAVTKAMQHGIDTEDRARREFMKCTELQVTPKCFVHPDYEFIRASLDGVTEEGDIIVEIKCPSRIGVHMKTVNGTIAGYYYCQVQHQLAVTGADLACFWSYTKQSGGFCHEIPPNVKFINKLIEKEILFWKHVVDKKEPDPAQFTLTF